MKTRHLFLLPVLLAGLVPQSARADARSSANYAVTAETINQGGARSDGPSVVVDGGLGGWGGAQTPDAITACKPNFAGQLTELTTLGVSAPATNIDEGASIRLTAVVRYNDGTYADVTATGARWSVGSPLSFSPSNGLARAGAVYQNASVTVQAGYLGYISSFDLLVSNTNIDDFAQYAGDGIDDGWQVQYFGLSSPNAGPNADPDGDGQNNAYEFAVGTSPTNSASRFELSIATVPGRPTWRNLTFGPTAPNHGYQLQFRPTLNAGYTPFGRMLATTNGDRVTVTDTNAAAATRFYRVRINSQ